MFRACSENISPHLLASKKLQHRKYQKGDEFFYMCTTCSELPSNINTMVLLGDKYQKERMAGFDCYSYWLDPKNFNCVQFIYILT